MHKNHKKHRFEDKPKLIEDIVWELGQPWKVLSNATKQNMKRVQQNNDIYQCVEVHRLGTYAGDVTAWNVLIGTYI